MRKSRAEVYGGDSLWSAPAGFAGYLELSGSERILSRDQERQLERLAELIRPTSFAVASATSRFSCASALRKTLRGWPSEVEAPPPRGRDGLDEV